MTDKNDNEREKKNTKNANRIRKIEDIKKGVIMFQVGPNDTLSQMFMNQGLLVADKQMGQNSCFIGIDTQ